jgi:parallel beta-helix repeat protein
MIPRLALPGRWLALLAGPRADAAIPGRGGRRARGGFGLVALLALACAGLLPAPPAAATASHDGCTRFLEPTANPGSMSLLVATGGTGAPEGVFCLTQDVLVDNTEAQVHTLLSLNIGDVTIDCLGHRLALVGGELPGIEVTGQARVTVRNCRISGFTIAIRLTDSQWVGSSRDHVIEDNVLTGNGIGILVQGDGSVIRRNRVHDSVTTGIVTLGQVDVLDNLVDGVTGPEPRGIHARKPQHSEIAGNVVRGVQTTANPAIPVLIGDSGEWGASSATIHDNAIITAGPAWGLVCENQDAVVRYRDNLLQGPTLVGEWCVDGGGNDFGG